MLKVYRTENSRENSVSNVTEDIFWVDNVELKTYEISMRLALSFPSRLFRTAVRIFPITYGSLPCTLFIILIT